MNSSKQTAARQALDVLFPEVLRRNIEDIVAHAQETTAAGMVAQSIWPAMKPEDLVRLDKCDRVFLLQSKYLPPNLAESAEEIFQREIPVKLAPVVAANSYLRGSKLTNLVKPLVQRRVGDINTAAERLFEEKQTDCLASPTQIRTLVIRKLVAFCYDELVALGAKPDEEEPKRHLKLLTALTNQTATPAQRGDELKNIRSGKTASFPYVLKYLSRGKVPTQPCFPSTGSPSLTGFSAEIERLIPEAEPLKNALRSYLGQHGLLSQFLQTDSPIAAEHAGKFGQLPREFEIPGKLYLPKEAHLERARQERYRLPDGIACSIGLTILLESLLRQAQQALNLPGGLNTRGRDLVRRLAPEVPLAPTTIAHLDTVFGSDQMALRDAVAHGAFVANDAQRIHQVLGGLTRTLDLLVQDLTNSAHHTTLLGGLHWAQNAHLDANHQTTVQAQFNGNLNLLSQRDTAALHKHTFKVLKHLTPDKSLLGRASCLIWADLAGDTPGRLANNSAAEFIGLIGSLITIEELFRAVQELHGERVLFVTPDSNGPIKCELSIFDHQQGRLLDPAKLARVFGNQWNEANLQESVAAVRAIRDKILHGYWSCLTLPKVQYLHLVVKLMFALSATIDFASPGAPKVK